MNTEIDETGSWCILNFDVQTLVVIDTAEGLSRENAEDLAERRQDCGTDYLILEDLAGAKVGEYLPSKIWLENLDNESIIDLYICPHCSEKTSVNIGSCAALNFASRYLCVCNEKFYAGNNWPFGSATYVQLKKEMAKRRHYV